MLTVSEALGRILATSRVFPAETVPLHDALDRMLAAPLPAPVDVPPWDNSAMDGYAVRAADTVDAPVRLKLLEVITAGTVGTHEVTAGCASSIMTGAPMPAGADAIMMVENTDGAQQGEVLVKESVHAGRFVRRRGSDVALGQEVLGAGCRLGPAELGLAASLGFASLDVHRRPRVAILGTGDELVQPGTPLGAGQIYASNSWALAGLIRQAGATPLDMGTVGDSLKATVAALRGCLDADVVITTGGVSVGEHDFVKAAFVELGAPMDFWKVAMKPGKPLAFGMAERDGRKIPLFGLPGNPVSCMVNFYQFMRPWLRMAVGDPTPFLPVVDAVVREDLRARAGRARFERVVLSVEDGTWVARSTGSQSSGLLTSMVRAHGLMMIAAEDRGPEPGDAVRVQLLDPSFLGGETPDYRW